MNLELLIKLVKLANHNNSDGEANTAARRVCKMIEEADFKFVSDVSDSLTYAYDSLYYSRMASQHPKSSGLDCYIDYFNNIVICRRCGLKITLEEYRNMPKPRCSNCGLAWK